MMRRCLAVTVITAALSISVVTRQAVALSAPAGQNRTRPAPQAPRPATPVPTPAAQPADAPPPPPPAPPAPTPAPSTPIPLRQNQSVNVKIDVTVTDQRPSVPVLTKTVSVVTGDGLNGSVRSQTNYAFQNGGPGSAPFNVDVLPVILADGKLHVRLTLQYDVVPPPGATQDAVRLMGTTIRDSVALILESGKPMVAVQSTDPVSDRKVSVEVKATVLK